MSVYRSSHRHNFKYSLEDEWLNPFPFNEFYGRLFPGFTHSVNYSQARDMQKKGIDRIVFVDYNGTRSQYNIDEKLRSRFWDDFLIEYWSARETKSVGWVAKPLDIHYIAYCIDPNQMGGGSLKTRSMYLIPFGELRSIWKENRIKWVKRYPKVEALNMGQWGNQYTTVSCAVPMTELKQYLEIKELHI